MRIYPDLIFAAEKQKQSPSAYRIWFLAKHFCTGGGTVPVKAFKAYLAGLGMKEATYNRHIREALELELLKREGGNDKRPAYYRMASWFDASRIVGVRQLGVPIEIPVEKLLQRSWKAEVWAGRLLQVRDRTTTTAKLSRDHNDQPVIKKQVKVAKPISRKTLEKVTGVKRRTQQKREHKAQVKQKQNVLVHDGKRGGYQPYGSIDERPELMVTSGGVPVEQLPNTRIVPAHINRGSRSRTRKVNKQLKALCKSGAIANVKLNIPLRYVDTAKQGLAILERDPAVTVLRYAGAFLQGVTRWSVFNA